MKHPAVEANKASLLRLLDRDRRRLLTLVEKAPGADKALWGEELAECEVDYLSVLYSWEPAVAA